MGELELFKVIASAGGAGAVIAVILFYLYRQSVEALFRLYEQDKDATQKELIAMREKDQEIALKHIESHDANTRATTELVTLIKLLNGRLK